MQNKMTISCIDIFLNVSYSQKATNRKYIIIIYVSI